MTVQPLLTGAHLADAQIERILTSSRPTRAQVIGPAGSGKTAALEFVRDGLDDRGVETHTFGAEVDIAAIPAEAVLIVDDLHLIDEEGAAPITERAHTPGAGLVVALRPGPVGEHVRTIERLLQRSSPPIILGEVSATEVDAHLRAQGRPASCACIEDILDLTGGAAWLVTFALSHDHVAECRGRTDHLALRRDLQNQVLQRVATLDAPLRRFIEQLSLGTDPGRPPDGHAEALDELVLLGHAEGLLFRNGRMVPAVRTAMRSSVTHRWGSTDSTSLAEEITRGCLEDDDSIELLLDGVRDPRVGDAIAVRADELRDDRPDHADRLYRVALRAGTRSSDLAQRRARAAWAAGDLDRTGLLVDEAITKASSPADAGLADLAASVLAARDLMAMAARVYGSRTYEGATAVRAEIAHIGSGHLEPHRAPVVLPDDQGVSSQLDVALYLLHRGLRSSLGRTPSPTALSDLVRASELYTASGTACPTPELPAVIAASVALGSGDLATARQVLDDAVTGGQGRQWARRRLLLWQGLVAIQAERPDAARQAYTLAQQESAPVGARDARLGHILEVTLARRFGDLAALQASWADVRGAVAHPDVDLYTIFPLATLVGAAARLGDSTTLAAHLQLGLDLLDRLGSPPLWSTHLWWAGVQQGILLNTPDALAPFAKALVGAADRSPLAATMASAGGVWVQVLAGKVDPDAVEDAARALGSAGLAWDGGRLAAHGARRSTDRRVSARLLSCARDLHPKESTSAAVTQPETAGVAAVGAESELSEREREVARLILKGKTYVEIGEAIFISPRTVEHHVAHMRRRLEAGSRSDLIAKLRLALGATQDFARESPNRAVRV